MLGYKSLRNTGNELRTVTPSNHIPGESVFDVLICNHAIYGVAYSEDIIIGPFPSTVIIKPKHEH